VSFHGAVGQASISYFGILRDFPIYHIDFQDPIASSDKNITTDTISLDRKPIYHVPDISTGVTTNGPKWFDEWFRDTPTVNMRFPYELKLIPLVGQPGFYFFDTTNFYPLNGFGYGTEGMSPANNYLFTLELHSKFYYRGGEKFTFRGDDDVWVYINNKLVIDLGGIHGPLQQIVDVDAAASSLGIQLNGTYDFDFFFCERHCCGSNFRMETSILPENVPPVAIDSAINTLQDTPISSDMQGFDINKDALTFSVLTQPTLGTLTIPDPLNTKHFTFTPYPGVFGRDEFTFNVFDGQANSTNNGTVSIVVNELNQPPIASDLSLTTKVTDEVVGVLPATDANRDSLNYLLASFPEKGSFRSFDNTTGVFIYTPENVGEFHFGFVASDRISTSNVGNVTIHVKEADKGGSNKLGPGPIAGIVSGALVFTVGLLALLWIFVVKPRWKKEETDLDDAFANGSILNNPLFVDALRELNNPFYQPPPENLHTTVL